MANPVVTFEMENGDIMKAELYPEIAPNTVNNFIKWSHYTIRTFENRPFFVPYLSIFFIFRKFLLTIHSHLWLKMYSTMSKWTFYAKR